MPGQILNTEDIGSYHLRKCKAMLAGKYGLSVLKTDAWNEIRQDVPGTLPIAGKIDGVKSWTLIEVMANRAAKARELCHGVTVLNEDLGRVEIQPFAFDAIICPSTLNFMPHTKARRMLGKFNVWLKDGGLLYLSSWVGETEHDDDEAQRTNEQRTFQSAEWEGEVSDQFKILECEVVYETFADHQPTFLVSYICQK